mmetsp:Transcript_30079/g.54871  ORF Transcript_30079/g.54871 Transcript_30079/m.54871 type:complete len:404 (+) Transcript_30079:150-1361(+)
MASSPQRRGHHPQVGRDVWAGRSAELFLQMLAYPPDDGTEFKRPQFQESTSSPNLQSTMLPHAALEQPLQQQDLEQRERPRPDEQVTRDRFQKSGMSTRSKLSSSARSGMSKDNSPSIFRSLRDDLEPPKQWTPALIRARGVYEPKPFKVSKRHASSRLGVRRLSMHKYRDANLDIEAFKVLQNKIKSAAYTGAKGQELGVLFARFDIDGSGELEFDEVERALRHTLKIPKHLVSDDEIQKVCDVLDADGSGAVSVEELVEFVTHEPEETLAKSTRRDAIDPSLPSCVTPLSKDILSNGELQRLAKAKEEGSRLRQKWRRMNHFGLGSTGSPYTFAQVFCEVEGRASHRMLPDPRLGNGRLTASQLGRSWSSTGRGWRKLPFESMVSQTCNPWQDPPRSRITF